MTNPTTNFGWVMPTSTDLVTDLPADFNVFGQGVDTSMADLLGGTTGQILSKTSATDMDFTWINNDQGDITAVTAGTGITGGGTSGAVTITNSMATAIDAKGDLIVGTGADTFDRLATGTVGQILSVDTTTTTGLKWIANDVGDITAVTVTAPITGGGTSGSVGIAISAASTAASGAVQLSDSTSTTSSVLASTPTATKAAYDLAAAAVPKSTVTTNGDVIYATGSAAVTRLGIGSTGQVLTVAAGVPSWATPASGSWTTWSPTINGVTIGNGTVTARYNSNNNVVFFTCKFLLGSTSSISGASVNVTLPVTAASTEVNKQIECMIRDEGTAFYIGSGLILSTTQAQVRVSKSDATYTTNSDISSTVPMTWTTSDYFIISGFYEKA